MCRKTGQKPAIYVKKNRSEARNICIEKQARSPQYMYRKTDARRPDKTLLERRGERAKRQYILCIPTLIKFISRYYEKFYFWTGFELGPKHPCPASELVASIIF